MEDLHEKLDIISQVVSNIGVRLDKFESDIGVRLDKFEGRVESLEARGCPSHENRVSHVNAAFQGEPGEKVKEPAKKQAWTEEPVKDSPAPDHSGKTKHIHSMPNIRVTGDLNFNFWAKSQPLSGGFLFSGKRNFSSIGSIFP